MPAGGGWKALALCIQEIKPGGQRFVGILPIHALLVPREGKVENKLSFANTRTGQSLWSQVIAMEQGQMATEERSHSRETEWQGRVEWERESLSRLHAPAEEAADTHLLV